jgi:HSP20 family protein
MASITRFEPLSNVSLHDEVERLFRQTFGRPVGALRSDDAAAYATPAGAFGPALDVEESAEAFVLHVELPGVAADDVEVSLEDNVLTVSGERRFYADREVDGFRRIERSFGRFHRSVRLPDRVDAARVRATHRDGVLTISVPKSEDAKPRRIAVEAA